MKEIKEKGEQPLEGKNTVSIFRKNNDFSHSGET